MAINSVFANKVKSTEICDYIDNNISLHLICKVKPKQIWITNFSYFGLNKYCNYYEKGTTSLKSKNPS